MNTLCIHIYIDNNQAFYAYTYIYRERERDLYRYSSHVSPAAGASGRHSAPGDDALLSEPFRRDQASKGPALEIESICGSNERRPIY